MNKTVDDYIAWSSRWVVDIIFHNNMFMSLDSSLSARVVDGELREESLMIFSNRSMSSGHVSEVLLCCQQICGRK